MAKINLFGELHNVKIGNGVISSQGKSIAYDSREILLKRAGRELVITVHIHTNTTTINVLKIDKEESKRKITKIIDTKHYKANARNYIELTVAKLLSSS